MRALLRESSDKIASQHAYSYAQDLPKIRRDINCDIGYKFDFALSLRYYTTCLWMVAWQLCVVKL